MFATGHPARLAGIRHRLGPLLSYRQQHRIASCLSLLPLPLDLILAIFGSDKQRPGGHNYGDLYKTLFRGFRYRRLKILEIGVLHGASLLAWRAFFPRAITIGIDIEDKSELAIGHRTRVYRGDQSSIDSLNTVCAAEGPFDIVIDDGSHMSRDQLLSFANIFPHLKDPGIYVIEDVQTSFWSGIVRGLEWDGHHINDANFEKTCCGWFLDLAKYLNHAEFQALDGVDNDKMSFARQIRRMLFEHNIIAIHKGLNTEPSNWIQQVNVGA